MSLLGNMRHFGDGELTQDVPSRRTKNLADNIHAQGVVLGVHYVLLPNFGWCLDRHLKTNFTTHLMLKND